MQIDVRTNVDKVLSSLVTLKSDIKTKASVRALNSAAAKVKTEVGREIRKVYNIKLGAINNATKVTKAHANQVTLRATVKISGATISLIEFAARAVNPWNVPGRKKKRKPGGGVSVQVKVAGGRRVVKHAFIATTKSGYRGVFMRESIPGAPKARGGDQIYKDRIVNLRSISLPTAVKNKAILDAVTQVGAAQFEKEFARQLNLLGGQVNGRSR
jgi:hypothetical protein